MATVGGHKLLAIFDLQNRKEGNNQVSIQLSHTAHQRHQRERNTNTKYELLDPNGNITSRKPNGRLLSHKVAKWLSKRKRCKRHTHSKTNYNKINHDRRTALERSVKSIGWRGAGGGRGLNRFYVGTILALTSAAV